MNKCLGGVMATCLGALGMMRSIEGAELSAEVKAKIGRMTPLFDGKTLDGWIQAPVAPVTLGGGDIVDSSALAKRLTDRPDAVAAFVAGELDEAGWKALAAYPEAKDNGKEFATVLGRNLRRIGSGP